MTERDGFSVAFLDLLSCGLGASILIFLIFSTLEHQGARNAQPSESQPQEGETVPFSGPGSSGDSLLPLLFRIAVASPATLKIIQDDATERSSKPTITRATSGAEWREFFLLVPDHNREALLELRLADSGVRLTIESLAGVARQDPKTYTAGAAVKLQVKDQALTLNDSEDD